MTLWERIREDKTKSERQIKIKLLSNSYKETKQSNHAWKIMKVIKQLTRLRRVVKGNRLFAPMCELIN